MKNKLPFPIITFIVFCNSIIAQVPEPASQPMTAPGAIGIHLYEHNIFWVNPPQGVIYNEIYFSEDSSLVSNMNPAVRILNGYPSTVFSSTPLNIYGTLNSNTKYFWRIVEYNAAGSSASPVWYFKSISPHLLLYQQYFDSGLNGWEVYGPYGFNNWYWQYSSFVGGRNPGELVFSQTPLFVGDSYMMSPEFPAPADLYIAIDFRYFEDWWSDTVVVGCAYTTNNGNTWTSIWELQETGNVGPEFGITELNAPGNFRLGFYYTGNSNNINFFYVDDITISTPLAVTFPPSFLQAEASTNEQKAVLNWNSGWSPWPYPEITGYRIQRKDGSPTDISPYVTIMATDSNTFSYEDQAVELNHIYTYRICTLSFIGNQSHFYGNEATAYVPKIIPVELTSFTASVVGNDVNLNWSTATELNNYGFNVEKRQTSDMKRDKIWNQIGFVAGHGTTTEQQQYSFIDESVSSGKYQYRLKQIDYDGTLEYSDIVEVEVGLPNEFRLEQNYPNPFNPSTIIQYAIDSKKFVSLKVYDVLGNEVTTLANEEKPAGNYEVEFSARGGSAYGGDARNLSSGIYFYQLRVGSPLGQAFIQTRKMVYLK